MLDCYIDYVGLQSCTGPYETEPASGMYITQLPGLTLQNIDSIADEGQRNWRGVWADVQRNAARKFYTDVINAINDCYQINDECDYKVDILCVEDNMTILANAWMFQLGVQIMLERIYSPRLNHYTTFGKKEAEELKDLYQSEYLEALKSGVKALDTSECELCCGGNPESVTYMP